MDLKRVKEMALIFFNYSLDQLDPYDELTEKEEYELLNDIFNITKEEYDEWKNETFL